MVRRRNRTGLDVVGRPGPRKQGSKAGLREVAGGFSQMISAGRKRDAAGNLGDRRQFRLRLAIAESHGPPEARRALARARLADIVAMRDALVELGRGAQAEFLMRKAGAVADDEEKFSFAIAAANVVMTRPTEKQSEASSKFSTWGALARAWCSQELARLYPNAGYGKASGESTDEPRVEFLCKYIADVPLATFNDDDYWRGMRPARAHCRTDSTFKAYAQVCRRVLKIAVELRIIPAWPLSAVCKLPIVAKGSAPVFPFLYPEEYVRLVRCPLIPIEWRVLWGFIVREGMRIGEAFRIRWRHLSQLPNGRWLLDVPETKTGRALNFVLNVGTGEVLDAFRRLRPDLEGPFTWLKPTNLKKAAERVRDHVAQSGTTRERLLFNDGRLRRLREHDLRSTFVTWCKLAGVDNETISAHTGHESGVMIKRYNRSKATIEHLGLPPYLPLDQALGLDVACELGNPEGAPVTKLLGSGETTTGAAEPHQPGNASADVPAAPAAAPEGYPYECDECHQHAVVREVTIDGASACVCAACAAGGSSAEPGAAPAVNGRPAVSAAPGDAPMARVRAGDRSGWTCLSCNAAGDAEGDWLEPVTSPLQLPPWPAHSELTRGREEHPIGAEVAAEASAPLTPSTPAGAPQRAAEPAHAPTPAKGRAAPAQRRPAGQVEVHAHGEYHAQGAPPAAVLEALRGAYRSASNAGAKSETVVSGPVVPGEGAIGRPRDTLAAPRWSSRDTSRDTRHGARVSPIPGNEESSMFSAVVREEGLEPPRLAALEPKSEPGRPEATKGGLTGGPPAPEATGSDRVSQAPVTPLLAQLQAAHRQASEEFNWTAARGLEPLIEAERVRLSNEAAAARAAAPPVPVRLEVVRARKGGAS